MQPFRKSTPSWTIAAGKSLQDGNGSQQGPPFHPHWKHSPACVVTIVRGAGNASSNPEERNGANDADDEGAHRRCSDGGSAAGGRRRSGRARGRRRAGSSTSRGRGDGERGARRCRLSLRRQGDSAARLGGGAAGGGAASGGTASRSRGGYLRWRRGVRHSRNGSGRGNLDLAIRLLRHRHWGRCCHRRRGDASARRGADLELALGCRQQVI
ncbi:hypothetical protein FJTKL_12277 [Diaporthe vaccinii]|uniref:Uncharacterized protein n=1 Tax=Diaporthe vaccinii TaxID=105482 RepID=A0ABR4EEF1_9PEZI